MINDITSEPLDVRIEIAGNPYTSPDLLTLLSEDNDFMVKWLVFLNPNTPQNVKDNIEHQIYSRELKSFGLGIDFYHGNDFYYDGNRDSNAIRNNVKNIISFYGGNIPSCVTMRDISDEDDEENDEYLSSLYIEFKMEDVVFEPQPNVYISLDMHNFVADEIEDMINSMGYEVESSDWY